MAKIGVITVSTTKGGAGKTTTSVHIAAGLATGGSRVLLVDLDKQGHCATFLGADPAPGLYDLLVKERPLRELVREVRPNLHLLPSNSDTVVAQDFARLRNAQGDLLQERIVAQVTGYDYVVFDTIPQGLLQECAVYCANVVVVPAPVDYPGLDGAGQFEQMVNNIVVQNKLDSIAMRVLPMFVDRRTRDAILNLERLQERFGERLLPEVSMSVRMREAISEGETIYEFSPNEKVAKIYRSVCSMVKELTDQIEEDSIG